MSTKKLLALLLCLCMAAAFWPAAALAKTSPPTLVTHIEVTITTPAVGKYPSWGRDDVYFRATPNGSVRLSTKHTAISWYQIVEADYTGEDADIWDELHSEFHVFEPGYYYKAEILFVPEEGYVIAKTVTATVNGQTGELVVGENDNWARLSIVFSPLDGELHIIRASIAAPERGAKPATEPATFEATPAGSVGFDRVEWKKIAKGDYNPNVYGGPSEKSIVGPDSYMFEDGFYYVAYMYFSPKTGHTIPETVIGTVNGEMDYYVYHSPYVARLRTVFEPLEGLDPIERIDAVITAPAPGAKPDINPTLETEPEDSAILDWIGWYRIAEKEYTGQYGEFGDFWEQINPEFDMFEYGYYYRTNIHIFAKGGYRFAETTVGTVNGRLHDGTHVGVHISESGMYLLLEHLFKPPHTHTAGTAWEHDETQHWNLCTADDGEKMNLADHTPSDWIIDTPATAEMEGSKHKECAVCKRGLEAGTIPPTGNELPETDTNSTMLLWAALLFVCGSLLLGAAAVIGRKEQNK